MLGIVVCACHPKYVESINRRISVQAHLSINLRPYSEIPKSKKGLGVWLK
jgi:hypothetical protein